MGGAPYKSAKEGHGCSFECFTFNHKRVSLSCLQQLDALEANNWTNSNVQRNHQQLWSRVWWHTTLWIVPYHHKHGVARGAHCIGYVVYAKMPCSNLRWSITWSFLPQICIAIALVVVLLKLHMKLAPGWALIQVNFDPIQEIGPKVEGGLASFPGLRRRRKDLVSAVRACT